MPFFTVIIPLYNKEKYIEKCINSILNQSFIDYEIIIVDDCGTDKSIDIAKKITDSRIRFIHHTQNQGLSAARNTGIKNSNANYITYLDADDTWHAQFLETISILIKTYPEAKIFGTNYYEVYNNQKRNPITGTEHLSSNFEGYLDYFKNNLKQGIYTHGSVCFDKEIFDKVGYYNESITLMEDLDFNIRANYHFKLAYSNTKLMNYYINIPNQLTQKKKQAKVIPNYDIYDDWSNKNLDLKKYLDFERYVLVKKLKKENFKNWKKIYSKIDIKNLNKKQQLLVKLPQPVLLLIDILKDKLSLLGIKIATY